MTFCIAAGHRRLMKTIKYLLGHFLTGKLQSLNNKLSFHNVYVASTLYLKQVEPTYQFPPASVRMYVTFV